MPETKIVKVKLGQLTFVHGARRPKGEIVELPETAPDEAGEQQPFASLFGEIVSDATPLTEEGGHFGGLHEASDEDDQ